MDKSTLGYAAILGLFEETGISKSQYNTLNTLFYVGMIDPFPARFNMSLLRHWN